MRPRGPRSTEATRASTDCSFSFFLSSFASDRPKVSAGGVAAAAAGATTGATAAGVAVAGADTAGAVTAGAVTAGATAAGATAAGGEAAPAARSKQSSRLAASVSCEQAESAGDEVWARAVPAVIAIRVATRTVRVCKLFMLDIHGFVRRNHDNPAARKNAPARGGLIGVATSIRSGVRRRWPSTSTTATGRRHTPAVAARVAAVRAAAAPASHSSC